MVYVNKKQSIGMENSDTNKSVQLPPMISGRVDLKDLDLSKEHWGNCRCSQSCRGVSG